MELVLLEEVCVVSLPLRENLTSRISFEEVPIKVIGERLPVDLIVLEMVDYDVILGMDWLSKYNIPFLCRRKRAMFQPSVGEVFDCEGTPRESKWLVVSALKAIRALIKRYIGYLVSIVGTTSR